MLTLMLSQRRALSATVLLMAAGALLAYGSEPSIREEQELLVIGTEYAFEAPAEFTSGVVTLRFVNKGSTELHNAALIRLADGHTQEDFSKAMRISLPAPEWAVHVGGVESIPPGTEARAITILEPGSHLIVCYHGEGKGTPHHALGMITSLDVVGPGSDEPEPEFDVGLVMFDYDYALSGSLKAGHQTIRVVGAGPQTHNVLIWKLHAGKTANDLAHWLESDRSTPRPAQPIGGLTALAPGERAYLPIDVKPGRYVFLCLVPDVDDKRTHLAHGMIREFNIR